MTGFLWGISGLIVGYYLGMREWEKAIYAECAGPATAGIGQGSEAWEVKRGPFPWWHIYRDGVLSERRLTFIGAVKRKLELERKKEK